MTALNETHAPALRSWVASAQADNTDFPIQNLPLAVFRRRGTQEPLRGGAAIGDQIVDLAAVAAAGVFSGDAAVAAQAAAGDALNPLMALGPRAVRIMLSASADFSTVLAAVNRAEVFRYIPKPWTAAQLLADLCAALVFDPCATPSADELERRRLEALERGITQVEWDPNGEVLMPEYLPTQPSNL